jgi:hypothetical protein
LQDERTKVVECDGKLGEKETGDSVVNQGIARVFPKALIDFRRSPAANNRCQILKEVNEVIRSLLNNANVARFLSTQHPGIFAEFDGIAKAQAL